MRLPVAECLGLVLAEEIRSDIDSPPFDKAMVDGYAIRAADLNDGRGELEVIEEIMAGATAEKTAVAGQCWRIMTGAPIPAAADAVVMHERTAFLGTNASPSEREQGPAFGKLGRVLIEETKFRPGQNILRATASMRHGETVLLPGHEIRPTEVGLLAEVGRTEIAVIARPSVAVLSTGNELVQPQQAPIGGQIRNSNGPMLTAAIRAAGATPVELGISRDDPAELRDKFSQGLQSDVLVISGGVSAGALDLVPSLLKELGVEEVFHHVHLKPGKPLWFGVRRESRTPSPQSRSAELTAEAPAPCLVFGLPGNPVSSLVCFELFVRPALGRLAGKEVAEKLATIHARLAADFVHRGDRPTFFPSIRAPSDDGPTVTPLAWSGSADLRTLVSANALALFGPGDREYRSGETIDVLSL
jgi:molybdopterin molybdotransferase